MANLRLYWLGPPAVECDGHPIRLEMRKTLALLAYISLSPQRPTRETLAALFWAEYDQQHALSNLRRNLASLSKSLPDNVLETDRERIGLRREASLIVDIDEFRELLTFAGAHPHSPQNICAECIKSLEKAVDIYRGDFFEGFNLKDCPEFDDWQFFQRESLRAEYAYALERLVGYYHRTCEWEKAIAYGRSWLALDRLNEPAQRMLIKLYFLAGQKSAAIRQYEECKQLLSQELGQDPDPETQKVYEEIRSGALYDEQRGSRLGLRLSETFESVVPILRTKLYIPKPPSTIVKRQRLVALIDKGIQLPLTVLSAPAGFGKTTLLAEWAAQTQQRVAWVGLDKGDNDPYRLIRYMVSAIQDALDGAVIGTQALELMQTPASIPTDKILPFVINDLIQIQTSIVLVLDDYHNIKDQAAHDVIDFLLEHQPAPLRLIISTRIDPPLSLARMRANQRMFEIRTENLRFNLAEANIFLNQIMELDLLEEDIAILGERTEGWIAGFKMVSIALQQRAVGTAPNNRHEFILTLNGSHRYIFDYLMEEVLSSQPPFIRVFLMRTSILERFCASLCEAVLGPVDHLTPRSQLEEAKAESLTYQQILESLTHANLFLIPMDEERSWFRYHHLFADLLQSRLLQGEEDTFIRELHIRASEWLEENNNLQDAISHAYAANDFDRTARLVELNYLNNLEWNTIANIEKWIDELPKEVVLKRPKLCSYYAYLEMLKGKLEGLEFYLDSAEDRVKKAPIQKENEEILCVLNLTRAHIAGLKGNWAQAIELAKSPLYPFPRYSSACNLLCGMAFFLEGELDQSRSAWNHSIQDNIFLFPGSLALSYSYLARISKLEGHLNEAGQVYIEALKVITERGWDRLYMPALVEFGLADLLRERNDPEKAWNHIRHGLENTGSWFPADSVATSYTVLSRLLLLSGDYPAAFSAVQEAEEKLKRDTLLPHLRSELEACSILVYLAQGNLKLAVAWLQDHPTILIIPENENSGVAFRNEYKRVLALRILLAQRKFNEVLILSDRMFEIAMKGMRYGRVIEIEMLRALALQGVGRSEEALHVLKDSLLMAQPEGYVRIFLDEGKEMQALLALGKQQGIWKDVGLSSYVEKLMESK